MSHLAFAKIACVSLSGNLNFKGEQRNDSPFYNLLMRKSGKVFHEPVFCTVLHNLCERKRMVSTAFSTVPMPLKEKIENMSEEDLSRSFEKFLAGSIENDPGSMFLQKIKTMCASMGHTAAAAKSARFKAFAMMLKFGLPAVMFTISPRDDNMIFLKIATRDDDIENHHVFTKVPETENQDQVLQDFVSEFSDLRHEHPGLSALHFEDIIQITIEDLLGWEKGKNNEKKGIFGDITAYMGAVEEQSRGTLHCHFLLWVKNYSHVRKGMANQSNTKKWEKILCNYADTIMSCKMNALIDPHQKQLKCLVCGGDIRKCSNQDLRELRTKNGESSFGEKKIIQCMKCNRGFSSEDIAKKKLEKFVKIRSEQMREYHGDDKLFQEESLWTKSSVHSRHSVCIKVKQMDELVTDLKGGSTRKNIQNMSFVNNVLNNLHSEHHVKQCFKDKCKECRMKLPKPEAVESRVVWSTKKFKFCDWKGNTHQRRLFTHEQKRHIEDCFVNTHSEIASAVFNCNTNVCATVDGGSMMHITCYVSKDTSKEDKQDYCKAAVHMIRKLRQDHDSGELDGDKLSDGSQGLRAIMGAVTMSTRGIIVAAPMAAYLVRNNCSRFLFSHEFENMPLQSFWDPDNARCNFSVSQENGKKKSLLSSRAHIYCDREVELDDVCLYDFFSMHTIGEKQSKKKKKKIEHWCKKNSCCAIGFFFGFSRLTQVWWVVNSQ